MKHNKLLILNFAFALMFTCGSIEIFADENVDYLDLETSETFKESKDLDQNYTFTQSGDTTYTDETKVKLNWTISDINATYNSNKTWDPESLQWTETKDDIDVTHNGAEFTLTNYSSKKVVGTVSFEVEDTIKDTFASATFDANNGKEIDSIVNSDHTIDETKKANIPSNKITASLTFNNDKFADLSATTSNSKYGTYTVSISTVPTVTANYLTFSSTEAFSLGTINIGWTNSQTSYLQSSTDAKNWTNWDGSTIESGSDNKIYLRGKGFTTLADNPANGRYTNLSLTATKGVDCSGNIMTLLDYENPNSVEMSLYTFGNLFSGCTMLQSAPSLPGKKLADYCYDGMFYGCTSLTEAPELPASDLVDHCYSWMFGGCSSLTKAPALSADKLASYCYCGMFDSCISLTQAPVLNATTLANSCYDTMFINCTSLKVVECEATDADKFITLPTIDKLSNDEVGGMFMGTPNEATIGVDGTPAAEKSYKIDNN